MREPTQVISKQLPLLQLPPDQILQITQPTTVKDSHKEEVFVEGKSGNVLFSIRITPVMQTLARRSASHHPDAQPDAQPVIIQPSASPRPALNQPQPWDSMGAAVLHGSPPQGIPQKSA